MNIMPAIEVKRPEVIAKSVQIKSLWDLLKHRPWDGKRTKDDINKQIKAERADWRKET